MSFFTIIIIFMLAQTGKISNGNEVAVPPWM